MEREYDLIVLGGGPAGYPAAIRAAQLGARVCLVEQERLGGTCLNWGCIPTKALQAAAHLVERFRSAQETGIARGAIDIDAAGLFADKARIVGELVSGIEKLLRSRRIALMRGTGRIAADHEVDVEGIGRLRSPRLIVATGSTETELPFMPFDGTRILSSKDILELGRIPESICIIGGGAIGCEFASIFHAFGARVTIVEMLPTLVATEDAQVSRTLQMLFRKRGIDLHLSATVTAAQTTDSGVVSTLADGTEIVSEIVLVSVGRRPRFAEAGIETIGIETSQAGIEVDTRMATSRPGVYAAGDVVGGYLLAHVATREGVVAAENALGQDRKINYDIVPSTIYTLPEIAHVGLTEEDSKRRGESVMTGRFPFAASGKAKGLGEEDGFIKWIARAGDGRLLGAHIIGPSATELLAPAVVALNRGLSGEQYAESIFPHPTLSEALAGAAEALYGRAIDLVK